MVKFNDIEFDDKLKLSLEKINYVDATLVQQKAIPLISKGKNIVCKSHTGSGKTLAFGIPISDQIILKQSRGSLILGPTRELVCQVRDELELLNKFTKLSVYSVYGGHGIVQEINTLKKGVQILAATPGRLMDHLRRNSINPKSYDTIILDEADRMLDMGFLDDIKAILEVFKPRNIHLFSATLEGKVANLIKNYMPTYDEITIPDDIVGKNIFEQDIEVKSSEKISKLKEFISQNMGARMIIFVSTKSYADLLTSELSKDGFKSFAIHGDKSQREREVSLKEFKKGKRDILVATDVAARGLQIDAVEFVINFDPAKDTDTHKHRIGRTGRMGLTGHAINFVTNQDSRLKKIKSNRSRFDRDSNRGTRKPFSRDNERPKFDKGSSRDSSYFESSPARANATYGAKPKFGDRKPFSRDSSYGSKKPFSKDSYGDRKPFSRDSSYGSKKPFSKDSYGDRKPFSRDSSYGSKKPFSKDSHGGRKPFSRDSSFGSKKPSFREKKSRDFRKRNSN